MTKTDESQENRWRRKRRLGKMEKLANAGYFTLCPRMPLVSFHALHVLKTEHCVSLYLIAFNGPQTIICLYSLSENYLTMSQILPYIIKLNTCYLYLFNGNVEVAIVAQS